jgi:hypothetical protein
MVSLICFSTECARFAFCGFAELVQLPLQVAEAPIRDGRLRRDVDDHMTPAGRLYAVYPSGHHSSLEVEPLSARRVPVPNGNQPSARVRGVCQPGRTIYGSGFSGNFSSLQVVYLSSPAGRWACHGLFRKCSRHAAPGREYGLANRHLGSIRFSIQRLIPVFFGHALPEDWDTAKPDGRDFGDSAPESKTRHDRHHGKA